MIDVNDKLIVIDDEGAEKEMVILFTFDSEDYKKQYVLFYDEDNEEEIFCASYDDKDNLYIIEDDKEWQMINEVLETFNNEEFTEETET